MSDEPDQLPEERIEDMGPCAHGKKAGEICQACATFGTIPVTIKLNAEEWAELQALLAKPAPSPSEALKNALRRTAAAEQRNDIVDPPTNTLPPTAGPAWAGDHYYLQSNVPVTAPSRESWTTARRALRTQWWVTNEGVFNPVELMLHCEEWQIDSVARAIEASAQDARKKALEEAEQAACDVAREAAAESDRRGSGRNADMWADKSDGAHRAAIRIIELLKKQP